MDTNILGNKPCAKKIIEMYNNGEISYYQFNKAYNYIKKVYIVMKQLDCVPDLNVRYQLITLYASNRKKEIDNLKNLPKFVREQMEALVAAISREHSRKTIKSS